MFDLIIVEGTVVDGTGSSEYRADVEIRRSSPGPRVRDRPGWSVIVDY